jgi:hypothetical protein
MSYAAGRTFFGIGNKSFYKLVRPMGGRFGERFGQALTLGSIGVASYGIFSNFEQWRHGEMSGAEAATSSGAMFFGCFAGGGTAKAIMYTQATCYLVIASLIMRSDARLALPYQGMMEQPLLKTTDYFDVVAPGILAAADAKCGAAGTVLSALALAYSMMNLDPGQARRFVADAGATLDLEEKIDPQRLQLSLGMYGDQALSDVETMVLICGE